MEYVTLDPRYIFAVSKRNTLKHGGFGHRLFFTEKFVCSCMVSFVMTTSSLLLCALLHTMLCCSLPYALAHFRSSSVLSSTIFPCRTSDGVRTSDVPNPKPAQYLRTSVIFRTSDTSDVRKPTDVRHLNCAFCQVPSFARFGRPSSFGRPTYWHVGRPNDVGRPQPGRL